MNTRFLPTRQTLATVSTWSSYFHPTRRCFSVMPKAMAPAIPLNGIFPIEKPSGPTSMRVLDDLTLLMLDSKLFEDPEKIRHHQHKNKKKRNATGQGVKVGQGGTLDPLADGVLVVGVNRGTKYLQQYLMGSKEYESIGILGAATTTMDAEGPVLTTGDFDNVTREDIEKAIEQFQGKINQTPPIFSALKMEGKPLYEYARENKPLPRAIPVRECTVSVQLVDFQPASKVPGDGGHDFVWPTEHLDEEQKAVFRRLTTMVHDAQRGESAADPALPEISTIDWPEVSAKTGMRPPTFKVRMTVSGGTYVRSIVHDIGTILGCGAHVVTLRRTRQGRFPLHGDEGEATPELKESISKAMEANFAARDLPRPELSEEELMNDPALDGKTPTGPSMGCVPWSVLEKALADRKREIEEQEADLEEQMVNEGADAKTQQEMMSKEGKRKARMQKPLREWEYEVLRRFISVPVPTSGGHGHARPGAY